VSFRKLKAQIYWPTTDQKVRGSNPCGRTKWLTEPSFQDLNFISFSTLLWLFTNIIKYGKNITNI
jgi:hypothetical protein